MAATLPVNQVDLMFRRGMLFSKFFTQSWGTPEVLNTLRLYQQKYTHKGQAMELIERRMPKMVIEKEVNREKEGTRWIEGWFRSPMETIDEMAEFFRGKENVARASWGGLFPAQGRPQNGLIIHLAATGDHTYSRRYYLLAQDLAKRGIASVLLENPFYGGRKPKEQFQSQLLNVADLFVMGGCLILECCFILRWAAEQGYSPLALTGVSMGGHMASLAATNALCEQPIGLIPCLSWTCASPVFTMGALSDAVQWEVLAKQIEREQALRQLLDERGMCTMLDRSHCIHELFPDSPARRLMWILQDEFTNLAHYPVPAHPQHIHFVVAEKDAYVPRSRHIPDAREMWPGVNVHVVPEAGHVTAYLRHHDQFLRTILRVMTSLGANCVVPPTAASASTFSAPLLNSADFDLGWLTEKLNLKGLAERLNLERNNIQKTGDEQQQQSEQRT